MKNRPANSIESSELVSRCVRAAVAGTLLLPALAVAQEAPAEVALDEIVITAQKREQRLQDVPIAVSVVGGSLVEQTGGLTAESLKQLVPTINIRKTNTPLNQSIIMRGVGTIAFAIAAQPSVAYVVDGVVLAAGGEAFGDLYDVERVEVLRGPQGTLFGKNASAGVVNVVSKQPGESLGGYIDVGYYEDDEKRIKASLDLPLGDRLKTRTTAFWGEFDGYLDNISTTAAGGPANGYDRKGIRTVWVADATDNVKVTFTGDWRESDDNCCAELLGDPLTGPTAAALGVLLAGTDFKGDESRKIKQSPGFRQTEEAWGTSLQLDVGLGDYQLTSITAYRSWDSAEFREGDWNDRPGAYVGNAFAQQQDFGPQELTTFSQELRVASPGGQFVDYIAGLYYSKTEADRFFRRDNIVCSASTLAIDATGQRPCTTAASTFTPSSASADFGTELESWAIFADGTINFSDRARAIAGLRWTNDDVSFNHLYNFSPIAGPGIRNQTGGGQAVLSGSNSSDEVSGRAGLQYDLTDDVMGYATYSRGYKGPAYNVFFNMTANNLAIIEAETADSYEIGFKSSLFDGSVLLNVAAFWAEYQNYQANNFLFLNGTLITTLTNAGDVTTGGVEIDFQARPTDALTLGGGIAYADARVDQFPVPPGAPPGTQPQVRSGSQLPLAPLWKASLYGDYRIPLGSFDLVPGLVLSYQDEQYGDLNEPLSVRIPGYTTIDLSLALTDRDDRWRVALIGRNITDESFAILKTAPSGAPTSAGSARYQISRDADQYFGIQARFNFGGK
jgi:iron complex outermembrane receptor protein